jgi:hypothetical protein
MFALRFQSRASNTRSIPSARGVHLGAQLPFCVEPLLSNSVCSRPRPFDRFRLAIDHFRLRAAFDRSVKSRCKVCGIENCGDGEAGSLVFDCDSSCTQTVANRLHWIVIDAAQVSQSVLGSTRTWKPIDTLEKDAPLRRAIRRCGSIIATPILSGLHHRYARI